MLIYLAPPHHVSLLSDGRVELESQSLLGWGDSPLVKKVGVADQLPAYPANALLEGG